MPDILQLMPGEWVEVRSAQEIFATLDEDGCLESLPFMPEMLAYCGRQFRVHKRADKTCDMNSERWGLRRMTGTVHLALLRCSGAEHGGCQAGCTLYWKEAWLKRVSPSEAASAVSPIRETSLADHGGAPERSGAHSSAATKPGKILNLQQLECTTCRPSPRGESEAYYRCQATEVARSTSPLPWWEPRQYLRDMFHNRVSLLDVLRGLFVSTLNRTLKFLGRAPYPRIRGRLTRTPSLELNLQPGELIEVRSKDEILATLDHIGKNRGMTFDSEMLPYCGGRFRVLRRVERIVNERTGQLIRLPNPSIILNDVVCTARYHRFCPRGTYSFWREIWLKRVEEPQVQDQDCEPSADGQSMEGQEIQPSTIGK